MIVIPAIPAKDDHAHHVPPTHNSDGWIYCEPCGGWVIHRPEAKP